MSLVYFGQRILDARVHIFAYQIAILDLVTVEDWGKEIFPKGAGVNLALV